MRGQRDSEERWKATKNRVARALISDPDLAFYFFFLASNRARKRALDLSKKLNTIIQNLEGASLPQKAVPSGSSQLLVEAVQQAEGLVQSGYKIPDKLLSRIKNEADQYTKKYLLPNVKSGSRLQTRGEDALSKIDDAKNGIEDNWFYLLDVLYPLGFEVPVRWEDVLPYALTVPIGALRTTAEMEYPPKKAKDYTLQLIASVSCLDAMSKPPDFFYRYFINEGVSNPANTRVVETGSSGGFVTAFQFRDILGNVIDPSMLGVHTYDLVSWVEGSAEVSYIDSESVFLDESSTLIPSGSPPIVRVESNAGKQYRDLRMAVKEWKSTAPSVDEFSRTINSLKTGSAPEIQQAAGYLAALSSSLNYLDQETITALSRLGIAPRSVLPIAAPLLAYSPKFLKKTKDAARDAIAILSADGFDYAENLLLSGMLVNFFPLSAQGASYRGKFAKSSYRFNQTISKEKPPSLLRPRYR